MGITECGSVSFESAGYCARYNSKKLVHGNDGQHEFDPISRRSSKNAIGKKWLEKYWHTDCFNQGYIVLEGGAKCGIPRYYEKWFKDHHPQAWKQYVTQIKSKIILEAIDKEQKITLEEKKINFLRASRRGLQVTRQQTRNKSREIILQKKFDQLQKYQKDI
jgi:hypothetical protein